MAMPNVEKNARAAARLGWFSAARYGAIVIYYDPPNGTPHLARVYRAGATYKLPSRSWRGRERW
jgi:hypothetical protein